MKNYKSRVICRAFALLAIAISIVSCSDGNTDKTDIAQALVTPDTGDWKVVAGSASESAVVKGQKIAQMCTGCHGIDQGEFSPAGPSLHEIAGRRVGSLDDYAYTQVLKNQTATWTVVQFDAFIMSPQDVYPGTGMAFTGIKNSDDRAALIAYLATKTLP